MLLSGQAGPARAQAGLELTAVPAFEGNYLPGAWLPIQVRLKNGGAARVVVVAAAIANASFRNTAPVDLPAGAEKQIVLYAAMEQETRSLRVTVEADGAVLAEQELEVRPRAGERLLGLVSSGDLRLSLPRRQELNALPFTVVRLSLAELPDTAAGLSSLSLLMLSDAPTEELSPAQRQALLGWVSAGGHLVLGGGPTAARTLAGLPPQLQPATPGGRVQTPDASLAALASAPGPGALPGVALTPAPDARAAFERDPPAWVQRPLGVGMVTQLAFDPGAPELAAWEAAPRFWDQLLRSPILASSPLGAVPGIDPFQEGILTGALSATPTVNLPPDGPIFGLLAIYAVLVGPGLALLLRRFDAQALMWLAAPALALVTGAAVFGLAFALRPDQRVVHQLSLIEVIGDDQARARTVTGVITPRQQAFEAMLDAGGLARPVRPAAGQYGGVSGVSGDLAQEGATLAFDAAPWQLQGLLVERQVTLPGVAARLTLKDGQLAVEIDNLGPEVLRDAVAAYGEYLVRFGDVAPGTRAIQTWPATAAPGARRGTAISYLVLRDELEAGRVPGQAPDRAVLVREALINAATTRGVTNDEGPVAFAWLDRSPLPVQVAAPGAAWRETTLLALRPVFEGSGAVTLPPGWMRPDLAASGQIACAGDQGAGIAVTAEPFTVLLRLPPGMGRLRAEELTLTMDSAGRWPNAGLTTVLFDWTARRWVEQDFDGPGDLQVANPAAYLRDGQLLVRFYGRITEARCLYIDATLRGVLP
ncbi:MAG: hypothetical protein RMK84_04740 [Oscillochloridaceae bacterium]|nr:hypothetical protein [Chloroflexaceae bacterium]MDW8389411.1 hypothetical protein [Oscillochloridaceae bacterium]